MSDPTTAETPTMRDEGRDDEFYQLVHPGGVQGIVREKPEMREQDAEFEPYEGYAVVFFPKTTALGAAKPWGHDLKQTLSQSPDAARAKFMDYIAKGEKWEVYADAGHRIRRVWVVDLGDADQLLNETKD